MEELAIKYGALGIAFALGLAFLGSFATEAGKATWEFMRGNARTWLQWLPAVFYVTLLLSAMGWIAVFMYCLHHFSTRPFLDQLWRSPWLFLVSALEYLLSMVTILGFAIMISRRRLRHIHARVSLLEDQAARMNPKTKAIPTESNIPIRS